MGDSLLDSHTELLNLLLDRSFYFAFFQRICNKECLQDERYENTEKESEVEG